MALSIGVSTGSRISLGNHVLKVEDVVNPTTIVVSVDGGKEVTVTDQQQTEVAPNVHVFAGVGGRDKGGSGTRLAFNAPKEIEIRRLESE